MIEYEGPVQRTELKVIMSILYPIHCITSSQCRMSQVVSWGRTCCIYYEFVRFIYLTLDVYDKYSAER